MSSFGPESTVLIDGIPVNIPVVKSYTSGIPVFQKSDWVPDEEAATCTKCQDKFSHFKRKHHCRSCGKVFCNKCCSEKLPLPHFGMVEPEKVCGNCHSISLFIVKATCDDTNAQNEGVLGVSELAASSSGLRKVVECGALHVMLSVADKGDVTIMGSVSSMLHTVAQQTYLNCFLVGIGVLKVLRNIITVGLNYHHLLSDCMGILCLLCRDMQIRNEAIKERIIEPLISVLMIPGAFGALASRVLLLFLNNFDTHEFILQNHPKIVPSLFKALRVEDFQMQGAVTKMLVYLSAGSDSTRRLILMEDEASGFPLIDLLKGSSTGVLLNAACVVSNLATVQEISPMYVTACGDLLVALSENECADLVIQVGRGLANFAEVQRNILFLLPYISCVVSTLLKSNTGPSKCHACRFLICLISFDSAAVLAALSRDGVEELLMSIFQLPGAPDFFTTTLLKRVSKLSVCS